MTEQLKQKIKDSLKILPQNTQDVVNNFDWINISEQIGKKYKLLDDETSKLQVIVGFVLIGSIDPLETFVKVEYDIGLSKESAEKITTEVFEKIFIPIGEKLTALTKKNIEDKEPTWEQNINFVLGGGDYSAFIDRPGTTNKIDKPKTILIENSSRVEDLKSKFTI